MATINDSTPVLAPLSPGANNLNSFGTHDARYGIGGFQRVGTTIERDNISEERRLYKVVYVDATQKFYYFDGTWKDLVIQGVGSGGGGTTARTDEEIQDIVGNMIAHGSHEGVSLIYNDTDGTLHLRLHGGATASTLWVDPDAPLSPPTPHDGSFGKPYGTLTEAAAHLSATVNTIQSVAKGRLSGVHDFRGKRGDIYIWAPHLELDGSILLDTSYNGTIHVDCKKSTLIATQPYVLKTTSFNNGEAFTTNKHFLGESGLETHGNLSVHHGYGQSRRRVYNEVRWESYDVGGGFSYPALGMKFFTKSKQAAYLMAGVTDDTGWNAIVDHDTSDYTQWAKATKITTGSNREAVIEDHGFNKDTNEWYVFVWYHDGTAQGVSESYTDIVSWLMSKTYVDASQQPHNTGDGIFEQDVHIYGRIFNDALKHQVHAIDSQRPEVAVDATLSRNYRVAPNAPYGTFISFDKVSVSTGQGYETGVLTAPFKGAYTVEVNFVSFENAATSGEKVELRFTPDGSDTILEEVHTHKLCTDETETVAGQPFRAKLKRTVLLDQGDTLVVKMVNKTSQTLTFLGNQNPYQTSLTIDSHNASQLALAKLDKRLSDLEAAISIDPAWKLVVGNSGRLSRIRRT